MLLKSLFFGCVLVYGSVQAAEIRLCDQPFRQFTITTAHALAAMICNLQANNLTSKTSRIEANAINFIHKWTVEMTDDSFIIEGSCATNIKFYNRLQTKPDVIHPGFKLALKIPRFEDRCGFTLEGTMTEIYEPQSVTGIIDQATELFRAGAVRSNYRSLHLQFADTGARNTTTGEFLGHRYLQSIDLGQSIASMLRSGFSGGSLNQGYENTENKIAIGALATMSQEQFFYRDKTNLFGPNFTLVSGSFQFNKSSDISYANRDAMTISGLSRGELYIRQNGVTEAADDPKMAYDYEGGTSAFYQRGNSISSKTSSVVGCTDYIYNGDYNTAQNMTVSDCRRLIDHVTGY